LLNLFFLCVFCPGHFEPAHFLQAKCQKWAAQVYDGGIGGVGGYHNFHPASQLGQAGAQLCIPPRQL
jgi:hypothetical protein